MVLHRHGRTLYDGLAETIADHLKDVASQIDATLGDGFLPELQRRWREHVKSMSMIRDIMMYMDRIYAVPNGLQPVHELGLALWRDHVARRPSIKNRVRATLVNSVNRERRGEQIDQGLVRATCGMLMDLGEDVYVNDFEEPYVSSTKDFYRAESQTFLSSNDCRDYLLRSESRLEEEQLRVKEYLQKRTEGAAVSCVVNELLAKPMRAVLSLGTGGVVSSLRDDKHEQLALMHKLFSHVKDGVKTLKEMMAEHVKEEGKALVLDPEKGKDPNAYVEGLLKLKDKYDGVIKHAFGGCRSFVNALHGAFETFINMNNRSPEYISLYVDDKLRKGLKGASEDDVEVVLDKVMILFRFLQEKDVFEKYYKHHLAKRLLGGKTTSDDAERSFIVKLKTDCGYQFTSKIEGMFNDIRISRDTMASFRTHVEEKAKGGGGDGSVSVSTTGLSPMDAQESGGSGGGGGGGGLGRSGGSTGLERASKRPATGGADAAAVAEVARLETLSVEELREFLAKKGQSGGGIDAAGKAALLQRAKLCVKSGGRR